MGEGVRAQVNGGCKREPPPARFERGVRTDDNAGDDAAETGVEAEVFLFCCMIVHLCSGVACALAACGGGGGADGAAAMEVLLVWRSERRNFSAKRGEARGATSRGKEQDGPDMSVCAPSAEVDADVDVDVAGVTSTADAAGETNTEETTEEGTGGGGGGEPTREDDERVNIEREGVGWMYVYGCACCCMSGDASVSSSPTSDLDCRGTDKGGSGAKEGRREVERRSGSKQLRVCICMWCMDFFRCV